MRVSKQFGTRQSRSQARAAQVKFLIICEGEKTEQIYFSTLNRLKLSLGIAGYTHIISLERMYSERGLSNPKVLLEAFIQSHETNQSENYNLKLLIDRSLEYLKDQQLIKSQKAQDKHYCALKQLCEKEFSDLLGTMTEEELNKFDRLFYEYLKNNFYSLEDSLTNIGDYLRLHDFEYDKEHDIVCLIVDRDRHSFTEQQFSYVMETCQKQGIHFYLSNPCFELWLWLHLANREDVEAIDRKKLLENAKPAKSAKSFIEALLCSVLHGYKKNRYDATILLTLENLERALNNTRLLGSDINDLRDKPGTNLARLIIHMRTQKP